MSTLAQELFKCLLEQADENNNGNRFFTGHIDINNNYHYFVKGSDASSMHPTQGGSKLEKVLCEIAGKSNLMSKLVDFLSSDAFDQVVNYTKMSNVFFEMKSLQKNMFKVYNQLVTVKDYLTMFPQHRKLVELLES